MWSVTIIAVVAVAGAVGLLVIAIPLAISIDRRRHRKLMRQHQSSRRLSIHRPALSANEENYAHVPHPHSHVRRIGRPARIPAMWNTVLPEESVEPILEDLPVKEPLPASSKRRKSIGSSLYGPSFHMPKTRRQKKVRKAISLNQMPLSPLSAITEFTDNTSDAPLAELPTETTPKATPERPSRSPQLHLARTRVNTLTPELPHESFARSVSMRSTGTAPAEPLPPLPTFTVHRNQRQDQPWRDSMTSLDTVSSSVLGTIFSPPSKGIDLNSPSANDGMQTFDFGFDTSRLARLGIPPGRQTIQGFCSGETGITSIRPSVEYNNGRAVGLESASHHQVHAIDDFRAMDAGGWNFQNGPHTRHSMQDYGGSRGKSDYLDQLTAASPRIMPPRPASVANGSPYQWDLKSAFSASRLSTGSLDTTKGHRRQNCVRISNLPILEPRNSRFGQISELQEEQTEPNKVTIPGLTLLEAGQPVLRTRASLVDFKGSPSPLQNRPVLSPTGYGHPSSYRASKSSAALARPDSDVFSTGQLEPRTPDTFRITCQQPSSPTSPSSIELNTPLQVTVPRESPTLPSPINAVNLYSHRSRLMGPRNPPAGFLSRTGSPSPVSNRAAQKMAPDELRESIMTFRGMNSEGRLLDASSSRDCCAAGEDCENLSLSTVTNCIKNYPRERRHGSQAFGPHRKMSIAISPSGMSLGGASIWEDVSVRGESPEPELPAIPTPVLILEDVDQQSRQTPLLGVPYPDLEAYENVRTKVWEKSRLTTPQGKGLGLRVGNMILETPGSLYDRDGFLKD